MSFLDDFLSKLTDVFQKSKDSNIGKLFSIVALQFEDLSSTLNRMEEWRAIDLAEGKALDRIGEQIVGEFRGDSDDEEYRLKIQARIVSNFLAYSDIESMNETFSSYLRDAYVGVQECWSLNDGTPFDGEPAALMVTVNKSDTLYLNPFKFNYSQYIGTGGVRTNWKYIFENIEVYVSKYPEEARVVIKSVGVRGVPNNIEIVKAELDVIISSYLIVKYQFTYVSWKEARTLTWGSLRNYKWKDFMRSYPIDPLFKWADVEDKIFDEMENYTWASIDSKLTFKE